MQNLKLPLCPKCLDTKCVNEIFLSCVVGAYPTYRCKTCNILWEANESGTFRVYNENEIKNYFRLD